MIRIIGEILENLGIAGLAAFIVDALNKGVKQHIPELAKTAIGKITTALVEEKRAEIWALIQSFEITCPQAYKNAVRRQRLRYECLPKTYGDKKPYLPGDEDKMWRLLTKLWMAVDGNPKSGHLKREVIKVLFLKSDEEFDEALEALNNDAVLQYIRKAACYAQEIWGAFYNSNPNNPGVFQKINARVDRKLLPVAEEIAIVRVERIHRRYRV